MRKFSVVIPESVENYDVVADNVSIVLAKVFGGYNQYEGNGGWVDDNGELMKEKHIRVEAYGNFEEIEFKQVYEIAIELEKVLANQDCIFVEYDGVGSILESNQQIKRKIHSYRRNK